MGKWIYLKMKWCMESCLSYSYWPHDCWHDPPWLFWMGTLLIHARTSGYVMIALYRYNTSLAIMLKLDVLLKNIGFLSSLNFEICLARLWVIYFFNNHCWPRILCISKFSFFKMLTLLLKYHFRYEVKWSWVPVSGVSDHVRMYYTSYNLIFSGLLIIGFSSS